MVLYVGDDWAEEHHDVELMDQAGRVLARARLDEGVAGMTRLHALVAEHLGDEREAVKIGTETDRGLWVQALVAAGYQVFGVNPLQAAAYRKRHGVSGAKSNAADAHLLADMVRTGSHELRRVAGDSDLAQAVKVVTRAHKTMVGEQTRHKLRLRSALRDFFPAALVAYADLGLTSADALELLAKAPDPVSAAKLRPAQVGAVLKRARRRKVTERTAAIVAALRTEQLTQPGPVVAAYAASVRGQVAILTALNEQISIMEAQVEAHFGQHPDAETYRSQPGLGPILGARVLAELGDDPTRYADARARKNYAGTSPITRASGKKKAVLTRHVHNDRLIDALRGQALAALTGSPGSRAYYDKQRARGVTHEAALRQLANRLVGILHGCLKTGTLYNEETAWSHHKTPLAA